MLAAQSTLPVTLSPAVDPQAFATLARIVPGAAIVFVAVLPAAPLSRPPPADQELLSCAALASRFGLPGEALRKRLQRWQATTLEGWSEVQERARNQPHYLYQVGAVRHLFTGLVPERSTAA